MLKMVKKIKDFEMQHPYLIVLISSGVGVVLGILLNYLFSATIDFKASSYFVVFFTAGELFRVRKRLTNNKKNKH